MDEEEDYSSPIVTGRNRKARHESSAWQASNIQHLLKKENLEKRVEAKLKGHDSVSVFLKAQRLVLYLPGMKPITDAESVKVFHEGAAVLLIESGRQYSAAKNDSMMEVSFGAGSVNVTNRRTGAAELSVMINYQDGDRAKYTNVPSVEMHAINALMRYVRRASK